MLHPHELGIGVEDQRGLRLSSVPAPRAAGAVEEVLRHHPAGGHPPVDASRHHHLGILVTDQACRGLHRPDVPIVVVHEPEALDAVAGQAAHDVHEHVCQRAGAKRDAPVEADVVEGDAVGHHREHQEPIDSLGDPAGDVPRHQDIGVVWQHRAVVLDRADRQGGLVELSIRLAEIETGHVLQQLLAHVGQPLARS